MMYAGSTFNFADRSQFRDLYTGTYSKNPARQAAALRIICTYAVTCHATGKSYVGSTDNFFRRWGDHMCHLRLGVAKNWMLQEAYDEHGPEAFSIRILRQYDSTDELLTREREDALEFFALEDLYNGRLGSRYVPGYVVRPDTRPKSTGLRTVKPRWYHGERTRINN